MSKIAVIGAGAWGTALALQAVRAGHRVALVAREPATARLIGHRGDNPRLPGYRLPEAVVLHETLPDDAELSLWAVPTQYLRASLSNLRPRMGKIIVCAKGIEVGSNLLPSEIVDDMLSPRHPSAILTGPNFAHEVAQGLPAAAVVASADARLREEVMATLATRTFRLYGSDDPIGAQLGGAGKNVIAIAAGAVIGAGLGENARAALVTRGLSELRHLTAALGGRPETIMGLSGLGDLLLTCTGPSSRNYSLGYALGRGEPLATILSGRSTVTEGVPTAAALVSRAGDIELPICAAVAGLVTGTKTLERAIAELLARPRRDE